MKSAVVVFPGSNRDHDMIVALRKIAGQAPATVWYTETDLPAVDLIVLPGGFSYGDYLRSGAIAARAPVMRAVAEKAAAGVPVLGVCNGFQILCEAGLLPGVLMRNASLRFVCREVHLSVATAASVFTRGYEAGQVIRTPVAHGDGNYRCDAETLARLKGEDRVAFRYVDAAGFATEAANPNGSIDNIAGILNERRNVLGMMPHPENLMDPLHGGTDGRALFAGLAAALGKGGVMRRLAIAVAAIVLAGCQSSTAPSTGTLAEAQSFHRTLIETVKTCWFSGDPTFAAYVYSPEINAATPRILIVPKDDPLALPLLVIEARGRTATVFGPLMTTAAGARIGGDIDRWNRGGTACA